MPSDLDGLPSYPLADALAAGVPPYVREDARRAAGLWLTVPDGPPVRFLLSWPTDRGNRGEWHAKRSHKGRTLSGYAGGHAPRGGGVAGLSAAGIRRALDGLDRQEARWASGEAQPKRWRLCRCCGREYPVRD